MVYISTGISRNNDGGSMFTARGFVFYMNILSACVFLGLSGWLMWTAPKNSAFQTWSESVVLGGNLNMSDSIEATNKSLATLCGRHNEPRMTLPSISFTLNSTVLRGSVFCTSTKNTYDSVVLMVLILLISCAFHVWRAAFYEPQEATVEIEHYGSVQQQLCPGLSYYIARPDFARWLEYTITSPMQIIVVCGTVYIRNSEQIALISTLQGALTLGGWTIELFIYHLQIAARESGKFSAPFNAIFAKMATVFAAAIYTHYVVWSIIMAVYDKHGQNLQQCDLGLEAFPSILGDIITLQYVLFSAFGAVPLLQILWVLIAPTEEAQHMWLMAGVLYATLSITSKSVLAIMYVKLISDDNCIDTRSGRACLY